MTAETSKSDQATCRLCFDGADKDNKLADKIETQHPNLACEAYSVSAQSPRRVENDEVLHRVIVNPRDFEGEFIAERPFLKVFANGLSVIRSIASVEDVELLVSDQLYRKADQPLKLVHHVLEASVGGENGVRSLVDGGERLFGVYDQTVPLENIEEEGHVPTHAGIFLRVPKPKSDNRKVAQRDYAGKLKDLFLKKRLEVASYSEGICEHLNQRASGGEFIK